MAQPFVLLPTEDSHQTLRIQPPSTGIGLRGRIRVPGDKSISHRALMLGAIASGETTIEGLLLGEDPLSTAACFRAMGAEISELNSELVRVKGIGLQNLQEPLDVLNAGNSGTTIRLMMGLLAGQRDRFFCVTGDESLRSRPMARVIQPLSQMGAEIRGRQGNTRAPLAISGRSLQPIRYVSPIASAQVKSSILLAGLTCEGQTTVVEPALSRDHSERMFRAFGAKLTVNPEEISVTVEGPAELTGQPVVVPGDISSAAFWLVAAAIVPDSDLLIENVASIPPARASLKPCNRWKPRSRWKMSELWQANPSPIYACAAAIYRQSKSADR